VDRVRSSGHGIGRLVVPGFGWLAGWQAHSYQDLVAAGHRNPHGEHGGLVQSGEIEAGKGRFVPVPLAASRRYAAAALVDGPLIWSAQGVQGSPEVPKRGEPAPHLVSGEVASSSVGLGDFGGKNRM